MESDDCDLGRPLLPYVLRHGILQESPDVQDIERGRGDETEIIVEISQFSFSIDRMHVVYP